MPDLLEQLIAIPHMIEVDTVDVAASPAQAWEVVRHTDLSQSSLVKVLFQLRDLPRALRGRSLPASRLSIDDLVSTNDNPGFSVLLEEPGREVVVGAIGKFWQGYIPFVHVPDAAAFARFSEHGWMKVAWALRVEAWGPNTSRITIEVWVTATDEGSWQDFKRYFSLIGAGSHFIRRSVLSAWRRKLGRPEDHEDNVEMGGDGLLKDAGAQVTQSIEIKAPPERIWPWLVQMGAGRAGFYSYDALDNGGHPSARQVHPDWQGLNVGDVIPATQGSAEGFEVLALNPPFELLLGGLYDTARDKQLNFTAQRPQDYWHVTWSFVLQPLDELNTRLQVRARAAFAGSQRLHALAIRPVHHFMQAQMLRQLALRAEGTLARDSQRDVIEAIGGALWIAFGLATPFLRAQRGHWGLDALTAARVHPGDEVVAEPQWSWTHGVTIDAPAHRVWPWVAQIGANRGGFHSYQWLENLVGCEVTNAEVIRPEWEVKLGEPLALHPGAPALRVTHLEPGHYFVASVEMPPTGAGDTAHSKLPWVRFSWLFWVEPLSEKRCRVISRARFACSDDLATRLMNGPLLLEPVGFAMDRKMLLSLKELGERGSRA